MNSILTRLKHTLGYLRIFVPKNVILLITSIKQNMSNVFHNDL